MRDGFSLIEALAATALLAVVSIPLLEMTQTLVRSTIAIERTAEAIEAELDFEAHLRAMETYSPTLYERDPFALASQPNLAFGAGGGDDEWVPTGRHLEQNITLVSLRRQAIGENNPQARDLFYIAVRRQYESDDELIDDMLGQ